MAFTHYSPVVIDHTKVPSTQSNFTVLVSQTDNRFKPVIGGGHSQNASGFDIRPYSDSGLSSALTYQLEKYNGTTGELVMWVKITSLSSSVDTTIYIGCGDVALTTDGSSTGTWNSGYTGIWHLGNGTSLSLSDATANGNNLTNVATVAAATGKIDGAAGPFDGTSQALYSTATIDLSAVQVATMSCWANFTHGTDDGLLLEFSDTGWFGNNGLVIDPNEGGGTVGTYMSLSGGKSGGTTPALSSGLHYWVAIYDATATAGGAQGVSLFVDGVAKTLTQTFTDTPTGEVIGNRKLNICCRASGTLLFMDATYIDEVRLSNVARSQDWITTEYNNQSNPGTFETLNSEVAVGGGGAANSGFLAFF